jgi:hypothetical protein
VEDHVYLLVELDVLRNVVVHEGESVVADVLDVLKRPRIQVVHANNVVALGKEVVAEVRTEEPGSTGDDGRGHGALGYWRPRTAPAGTLAS